MKKRFAMALSAMMMTAALAGCGGAAATGTGSASANGSSADDKSVVIYTSSTEYQIENYKKKLKEKFPDYDITIEYLSTGKHAAKLAAEGTSTPCDITFDLEYGYLDQLKQQDLLADLSSYDYSIFVDDMQDPDKKYLPQCRNGGCITVSEERLKEKGLPIPQTYEDLLKEEYKGLISMPSPKTSGTGYMFVKSLVNAWGEDKAFEYFDKLSANVKQFTESGSGPVNALVEKEADIALAMISQSVLEINNGQNLKILFFEEGAPYSACGLAMIKGKENKKAVKDVFDYFYTDLCIEDKQLNYPEKVYKDKDFKIENYPENIQYADMSNGSIEEKERLLEKWNH